MMIEDQASFAHVVKCPKSDHNSHKFHQSSLKLTLVSDFAEKMWLHGWQGIISASFLSLLHAVCICITESDIHITEPDVAGGGNS